MRKESKPKNSCFAKYTASDERPLHALILEICRKCYAVSDDAPRKERMYAELLSATKADIICKDFNEDDEVDAAADYILNKKK